MRPHPPKPPVHARPDFSRVFTAPPVNRLRALVGVVAISFTPILVRLADVSPTTAAFFRTALAVPVLLGIVLLQGGAKPFPPKHPRAAWAGVFFAVDLILFHTTIRYIGAGLATVLGNTQVLFVGLGAWILHGERPSGTARALVPVVFLGLVMVSGLGRPGAYGTHPVRGVLTGVGTALAYASYLLTFRAATDGPEPSTGPLLETTLVTGISTLVFGLLVEPGFTLTPTAAQLGWLVVLALVGQVLGWILIGRALPRLPALDTSVLLLLQPLLSVVWGWLIFAEHLSVPQAIGCFLILTGMGLLHWRGTTRTDSPESA